MAKKRAHSPEEFERQLRIMLETARKEEDRKRKEANEQQSASPLLLKATVEKIPSDNKETADKEAAKETTAAPA